MILSFVYSCVHYVMFLSMMMHTHIKLMKTVDNLAYRQSPGLKKITA